MNEGRREEEKRRTKRRRRRRRRKKKKNKPPLTPWAVGKRSFDEGERTRRERRISREIIH